MVAGIVGALGLGVAAEVALLGDPTPAVIAEEALDLALIGLVVAALQTVHEAAILGGLEVSTIVLRAIYDALVEGLDLIELLLLCRSEELTLEHHRRQLVGRIPSVEGRAQHDLIAIIHEGSGYLDEEGQVDHTLAQGRDLDLGALCCNGHALQGNGLDAVILLGGSGLAARLLAQRIDTLLIGDDLGELSRTTSLLLLVGRE